MKNYLTSKIMRGGAGFTPTPFPKKGVSLQSKRGFTPTPMHIGVSLQSKRGFTLIELLVVIAIIGLLSSVVLASLNSARGKARNAKRVSDLKQISLALEFYFDDNGSYPNPGWGWRSECASWGSHAPENVIPGLVPTYMSAFPADPSMNKATSKSCYLYLSNGTDYALLDHDGPDINYTSQSSLEDPTRDGGSNACTVDASGFWSWKISTQGGRCW